MAQDQDWKTIVFRKQINIVNVNPVEKEKVQIQNNINRQKNKILHAPTSQQIWKVEQKIDDEHSSSPIKLVPKDVAQTIMKARVANKMTQASLAKKLNLQERIIKDIESGKAVYNKNLIAQVKKALNLNKIHERSLSF